MSFEQALEALEKIVENLERGDVPLDQSIRIYERGEALKAHCDRLLKAAEDKVEKIRLSRDGKPAGTADRTASGAIAFTFCRLASTAPPVKTAGARPAGAAR
jgi:exodeoxyribonuclease VII small subunit